MVGLLFLLDIERRDLAVQRGYSDLSLPSGRKARVRQSSLSEKGSTVRVLLKMFHSRTVRSKDAVAKTFEPEGENAGQLTGPVWPAIISRSLPVCIIEKLRMSRLNRRQPLHPTDRQPGMRIAPERVR